MQTKTSIGENHLLGIHPNYVLHLFTLPSLKFLLCCVRFYCQMDTVSENVLVVDGLHQAQPVDLTVRKQNTTAYHNEKVPSQIVWPDCSFSEIQFNFVTILNFNFNFVLQVNTNVKHK